MQTVDILRHLRFKRIDRGKNVELTCFPDSKLLVDNAIRQEDKVVQESGPQLQSSSKVLPLAKLVSRFKTPARTESYCGGRCNPMSFANIHLRGYCLR